MPNLLASDVVIEEETPQVRGIPSLATAVLGAVGVTERGPVGQAVMTQSPDEWERVFGGHLASSDASLFVKMFFEGGGTELHFVRAVHCSTSSDPTSKTSAAATLNLSTAAGGATAGSVLAGNTGPYALAPADNLVFSVDGAGNATATFNAVAAARESGAGGPFVMTNGMTLLVALDGGSVQSIAFLTGEFVSIGAATAAEVAAVINAKLVGGKATVTSSTKVTITSDRKGTGSGVNVSGGTANAVLTFTTGNIAGTGNVSNIAAVTVAEIKSIVEAAVPALTVANIGGAARFTSNTTGGSSSILVVASSTADDELALANATVTGTAGGAVATLRIDAKSDGTYGNQIRVIIEAATSGEASRFNMKVESKGSVVESFPNLTLSVGDARYVETYVNGATGSALITVTDLEAAIASPGNLPVVGTFGPLTGGNDGLVGLADTDFNGGTGANGAVGLRCLDTVQNLTLLAVPGRATASVHNAMITYCEIVREGSVFGIFDPPRGLSAAQMVAYVKTTAAIQQLSEFAAIYWPNVLIDNPSKSVFGNTDTIVAPPSGAIAALYARTDAAKPWGVFTHPAGTEVGRLFNVRGLEMAEVKDKKKREIVFPELINPISVEPGTPIFVDGARCLKSNGNWPTVGERRGVIYVESSLKQGLAFLRHRNIAERLYQEGKKTTKAFLLQGARNEAFASTNPADAFTLDWGKGLNPASTKFARQVVARVGLATSKPAEFIILKVSPDNRALEAELAAA